MKKKPFYSITVVIILYFVCGISLTGCKEKICGTFTSKDYDFIYPNPDSTKCDYIILKRKKDDDKLFSWISQEKSPKSVLGTVNPDDAVKYIRQYKKRFNNELKYTSFIDLDRREVLLYLIDVMDYIQQDNPGDKSNVLRIYLADKGITDTSITTIVTTASEKGETYLDNPNLLPLDWGNLCPPPTTCISNYKANLLQRAITESR